MKLAPVPITLSNCAKTYRGARVLEPLELRIGAGETLVLLGPSGCGKTTTLRLIAGLETPDTGGRVHFGDEDVTALPIERRAVGMVFQNYALFPNLTVRGNIGYGLKIRRVPAHETRRRVDELLAMMRLTEHADKPVDQLSGGQRQRVALARAIAPRPRVLLLDEPLTALDARLRDTLRGEMNALLRELGITTVYVTHDQAEAMELGDRIVVMSHGRIEQIGAPRDIYYRPANRAVAQFIGTINRLAGAWRDGMLTTRGGAVPAPPPRAAAADDAQNGADAAHEVFFRPEDAWLADPSNAQLRGTIEHAVFLGERTRLTIRDAAPDALIVDVAGRVELARGTAVGISIAEDALIALS
ncbi:ABC transporter ATP-binding protein [Paraburkholderia rhizosphaerae]|uniref:Putative spermidine/putrescine transport system ATP-binding protein n=1 Tax=Paraburkholderia rhizosphaerae TaxID=480658 RepID=A0A4R8LHL1_9BURK|nr:ABC transporter ATP-binding protein [Paraburkholderia rhizosphaerae]TDY42701.1 putative spermidine/putrescine transport system ATP-binding protein [Paraburkholderia rhizosphaerae]